MQTGDPARASRRSLVSIDGGTPFVVEPRRERERFIKVQASEVQPGVHAVVTVRLDVAGNPVGETMTFRYRVE
jgi:hypothetical protein